MTERTTSEQLAASTLKAEIVRKDWKYADLAKALGASDEELKRKTGSLAKKITSGKFTFAFFLECIEAMEIKLNLE